MGIIARFVLLIMLQVLLSPIGLTQSPVPFFRNYSTEHGLPSPEVHCIYQDRDGYLWFGTDNGVARFDGYKFKSYDATDGLENNMIVGIMDADEGRIFFTALDGSTFEYFADTISASRYNEILDRYRASFVDASLIDIDKEGNAFFNLVAHGLLKVDASGMASLHQAEQKNSIAVFEINNSIVANLNNWGFNRQSTDDDRISLDLYKSLDSLTVSIPLDETVTTAFRAFKMSSDEFLFCLKGFVYLISGREIRWKTAIGYPVLSFTKSLEGGFWLGMSHNQGLRYYNSLEDLRLGRFSVFLPNQTITSIYSDRDRGLWVASHDAGIFYSANPRVRFIDLKQDVKVVTTVEFLSEHETLIGYADGDISKYNTIEGTFYDIPHTQAEGASRIYDLFFDQKRGVLWADNEFISSGKIHMTVRFKDQLRFFSSKKYTLDLHDGNLWLVRGWGFYKIDLNDNNIILNSSDYIPPQRIYSIYASEDGKVWMSSNKGLFEWRDSILVPVMADHPAFKLRIEDIDAIDGRDLVLGTKGFGVIIWRDQEKIIEINTSHGLASNMIEDVHVDENNILWISTFNGLSRISLDSAGVQSVRTYNLDNGLPSNEIYQVNSYQGQPWICTGQGLIRWEDVPFDSISYSPRIQRVLINGDDQKLDREKFKYIENDVTFEFLTLDFQQFGQVVYRYRLSSKDSWNYTKNTSISYARLSPGDYEFEIQAQNKDGIWSPSTCYLFIILNPFYKRWWFILMAFLLILMIGYMIVKWWTIRRNERKEFEREINELKKSALQAQMNPHFIFNCLNSIQSFVNTGQREEANNYLLNFSSLIRGCLHASMDKQIPLSQDIAFIRNYLDLEKMRFSPEFDYYIEIGDDLDADRILIEPMLILPFVENAVIHGLSRSDRQGRIRIVFSQNGKDIKVMVQDNGPGFRSSQKNNEYEKSAHKSVGITITRKRLELVNRQKNDLIEMKEIVDEMGEIGGSQIVIKIKSKKIR